MNFSWVKGQRCSSFFSLGAVWGRWRSKEAQFVRKHAVYKEGMKKATDGTGRFRRTVNEGET